MNRKYIYYVIGAALCIALGYSIKPDKTETITVEKVREVVKNIKGLKETIVVVQNPDGSVSTTTTRSADEVLESDKSKSSKKSVTSAKPNWGVSAYSTVLEATPEYTLTLDRRILGNLSVGVLVQSDLKSMPAFGIGIRFEF